jgi:hypothetical protein
VFGKALASVMAGTVAMSSAQILPDQRPGCFRNALTVSAGSQPTAHATGVQAIESATIQVNADMDARGVYFSYTLGQVRGDANNPPSYAWQLDGGGWRSGSLSAGFSGSAWSADPSFIGDLSAGSTHTLEFAITFTSSGQAGTYSGDVELSSFMCGNQGVDGALSLAFTPGAPASPSPSPTPSHSAPASPSPSPSSSPSPSATPSASASPSQTPLVLTTALSDPRTPVAVVKAAASGGGGTLALILTALVMLLGLMMGFVPGVVRHRRLRVTEAGAGPGPGPGDGGETVQQ